jgi:hypothetical protein
MRFIGAGMSPHILKIPSGLPGPVAGRIADYGRTQRDVEASLKHGGIVSFIDGDMECY